MIVRVRQGLIHGEGDVVADIWVKANCCCTCGASGGCESTVGSGDQEVNVKVFWIFPSHIELLKFAAAGLTISPRESVERSFVHGEWLRLTDGDGVSIPAITEAVIQVDGVTSFWVKTNDIGVVTTLCHNVEVAVDDFPRNLIGVGPATRGDGHKVASLRKTLNWGRDEAEGQDGGENLQLFHDV